MGLASICHVPCVQIRSPIYSDNCSLFPHDTASYSSPCACRGPSYSIAGRIRRTHKTDGHFARTSPKHMSCTRYHDFNGILLVRDSTICSSETVPGPGAYNYQPRPAGNTFTFKGRISLDTCPHLHRTTRSSQHSRITFTRHHHPQNCRQTH